MAIVISFKESKVYTKKTHTVYLVDSSELPKAWFASEQQAAEFVTRNKLIEYKILTCNATESLENVE